MDTSANIFSMAFKHTHSFLTILWAATKIVFIDVIRLLGKILAVSLVFLTAGGITYALSDYAEAIQAGFAITVIVALVSAILVKIYFLIKEYCGSVKDRINL